VHGGGVRVPLDRDRPRQALRLGLGADGPELGEAGQGLEGRLVGTADFGLGRQAAVAQPQLDLLGRPLALALPAVGVAEAQEPDVVGAGPARHGRRQLRIGARRLRRRGLQTGFHPGVVLGQLWVGEARHRRRQSRALQIDDQLAGGLVTVVRLARQHAGQDLVEHAGHLRDQGAGRREVADVLLLDHLQVIVPGERHGAGHQVVEGRSQGVDVAAGIGVLGVDGLLVGHVVRGAEALAGGGQVAGIIDPLGQAQIDQLTDAGAGDEDVVRLDVAVHDAARVGVLQGTGNVQGNVDRVADGQLAQLVQQRVGRRAVHELQHQVVFFGGLVLAGADDGTDEVGVVQLGATAGLAVEAVDVTLVAGQLVAQHLDGHLDALFFVVAEVDRPHPPFAQAAQQPVLAEVPQFGQRIGGGPAGHAAGIQVGVFHGVSLRAVSFRRVTALLFRGADPYRQKAMRGRRVIAGFSFTLPWVACRGNR
jgi:hypothetical protein